MARSDLKTFIDDYCLPAEALSRLNSIVSGTLSTALGQVQTLLEGTLDDPSLRAALSKTLANVEATLYDAPLSQQDTMVSASVSVGEVSLDAEQTVVPHDLETASTIAPDRMRSLIVGDAHTGTLLAEPVSLHEGFTLENDDGERIEDPLLFATPQQGAERYQDQGLLGIGGMGEVRRVRERELNRSCAMKIIRRELLDSPRLLARFIEEAQINAQLQHPGIIPIHELGQLPDGRYYFTMQEVRGRTLSEVNHEVHAEAARRGHWQVSADGWSLRRLIDAFRRVCEAVGYAHARGVIHRDLKPDNIMLGRDGEVLVVDWGIAKVTGRRGERSDDELHALIQSQRAGHASLATQYGSITGTPAYMPPEQALGQLEKIDARSDVYALGAILYELLTGHPPHKGADTEAVLLQILMEDVAPPTHPHDLPLEADLVAICLKAMSREPDERFPEARQIAREVGDWLDGARRRDRALELVNEARALLKTHQGLLEQAQRCREEGAQRLSATPTWSPESTKRPGWASQDKAARLELDAQLELIAFEERLHAALTHVSDLADAHDELCSRYHREHQWAEAARDEGAMARFEKRLDRHARALPENAPQRARYLRYLEGHGALSLVTDPPGAEVLLHRYELRDRRLVPGPARALGRAPLREVPLEHGSYLLVLRLEGHHDVRYPVFIEREGRWCGVRPGSSDPHPVELPPLGSLAADDVYVPAGWFWAGGDPLAFQSVPRHRQWIDAFVTKRFAVTNRQYLDYLNALLAAGQEEEALERVPRERSGTHLAVGAMIYGRDPQGRFIVQPDADGDLWLLDEPVRMVHWFSAMAYCDWFAAQTGHPWRLHAELEREKASRGVDGRFYPWGDHHDPSWSCMRESKPAMQPSVVDTFPVDESPYGARGMAGNFIDLCLDAFDRDMPPSELLDLAPILATRSNTDAGRAFRGGTWASTSNGCRSALRSWVRPFLREGNLSFRLCRSWRHDAT